MPVYSPGVVLFNKYRIEDLLGEGSFGEVYLATHLKLNALRALKVLRKGDVGVDSQVFHRYRQRFELEARLGALINHPNVIQVYDLEQAGDELVLSMEYAHGGNLGRWMEEAESRQQPIQLNHAVRLATELARGLAALHARGIVHRDLKPSNILFGQEGAKVADLGVAQVASGGMTQRTEGGEWLPPHPGTPAYMSPEQESTTAYLTSSSDIYSLGVVLFQTLTLRNPRNLPPGSLLRQFRPDAPEDLELLLADMLNPNPAYRPFNGEALGWRLAQLGPMPEGPLRFLPLPGRAEPPTEVDRPNALTPPLPAEGAAPLPAWGSDTAPMPEPMPPQPGYYPAQSAGRGIPRLAILIPLGLILLAGLVGGLWWLLNQTPASQPPQEPIATLPGRTTAPPPGPTTPGGGGFVSTRTFTPLVTRPSETPTPTNTRTSTPTRPPDAPPPCTASGQVWLRPKDGMDMVCVPAGSFTIGQRTCGYAGCEKEVNGGLVNLPGYWIDRTEVTNAMFTAFVADTNFLTGAEKTGASEVYESSKPMAGANWRHPQGSSSSISGLDDHPVVQLNWYAANAYCKWVGGLLPSEAEWEKAARGPDGRLFPWSNNLPDQTLLNAADRSLPVAHARKDQNDGYRYTSPVGYFPRGASPFGVLDMAGNAWEWTRTLSRSYPYSATDGRELTSNPLETDLVILRGGCWFDDYGSVRSTLRYGGPAQRSTDGTGFRCVMP